MNNNSLSEFCNFFSSCKKNVNNITQFSPYIGQSAFKIITSPIKTKLHFWDSSNYLNFKSNSRNETFNKDAEDYSLKQETSIKKSIVNINQTNAMVFETLIDSKSTKPTKFSKSRKNNSDISYDFIKDLNDSLTSQVNK